MRTFGTANGAFTKPMPNSNGNSCLGSGAKMEPIVGAALRCNQATGVPRSSSPASSLSTETV
jgi:hypothetical protein